MSCYDKVFQKRVNLNVNFSRNWNEYKQGFGNFNGDFWLGELKPLLPNLRMLSFSQRGKKIRIIFFMKSCQGDKNEGDNWASFKIKNLFFTPIA